MQSIPRLAGHRRAPSGCAALGPPVRQRDPRTRRFAVQCDWQPALDRFPSDAADMSGRDIVVHETVIARQSCARAAVTSQLRVSPVDVSHPQKRR